MSKIAASRTFNYIDGVTIHTARRIAKYEFGDFLLKVVKNDREKTFDVYLLGETPKEKINYFRNYWGTGYRVFLVENDPLIEEDDEEQED